MSISVKLNFNVVIRLLGRSLNFDQTLSNILYTSIIKLCRLLLYYASESYAKKSANSSLLFFGFNSCNCLQGDNSMTWCRGRSVPRFGGKRCRKTKRMFREKDNSRRQCVILAARFLFFLAPRPLRECFESFS